jgi:hypothetical protein
MDCFNNPISLPDFSIDPGDSSPGYIKLYFKSGILYSKDEDGLILRITNSNPNWGDISGTLSNQIDLDMSLNDKVSKSINSIIDPGIKTSWGDISLEGIHTEITNSGLTVFNFQTNDYVSITDNYISVSNTNFETRITNNLITLTDWQTGLQSSLTPNSISSTSIIGRDNIRINYSFGTGTTFTALDSNTSSTLRIGVGLVANGIVSSARGFQIAGSSSANWDNLANRIRCGDLSNYNNTITTATNIVNGYFSVSSDRSGSGEKFSTITSLMKGTGANRKCAGSFISVTTGGMSIGLHGAAVGNITPNAKIGVLGFNSANGSFTSYSTGSGVGDIKENWSIGVAGMVNESAVKSTNCGIYGFAGGAATNYAGYFEGRVVIDGDIESLNALSGLILRSPNNTRWRITINNAGTLITTVVS